MEHSEKAIVAAATIISARRSCIMSMGSIDILMAIFQQSKQVSRTSLKK
jgi:hypothetical protein